MSRPRWLCSTVSRPPSRQSQRIPPLREARLNDADSDEIDALLLADLGTHRLRVEWTQARILAAGRVLYAIMRAHDEIHGQLAALADAAIEKLQLVAALGDVALDKLVRDRRVADAQALAEVDVTASELTALYELRDSYLVAGGGQALTVGGFKASRWRNPEVAQHHSNGATLGQQYVSALNAGVGVVFGQQSKPGPRVEP